MYTHTKYFSPFFYFLKLTFNETNIMNVHGIQRNYRSFKNRKLNIVYIFYLEKQNVFI